MPEGANVASPLFLYNTALIAILAIGLVLSWTVPREQTGTVFTVVLIGGPIVALVILGTIYIRRQRRK